MTGCAFIVTLRNHLEGTDVPTTTRATKVDRKSKRISLREMKPQSTQDVHLLGSGYVAPAPERQKERLVKFLFYGVVSWAAGILTESTSSISC